MECEDDGSLKSPTTSYGLVAKLTLLLRYVTLAVLYVGVCGCLSAGDWGAARVHTAPREW